MRPVVWLKMIVRWAIGMCCCAMLASTLPGCATIPAVPMVQSPAIRPSTPLPPVQGSPYIVQHSDTLWGIAQAFGVDGATLAAVNHLRSPTQLKLGQRLFIPPPLETTRFLWPARGQVTRTSGSVSSLSRPGLEIRAAEGGFVRASRSGLVAVAAHQVADLGDTIILDHGDGYTTIYCGLDQLLVSPGAQVRQGSPVGRVGRAPLYFEIRHHTIPHDPSRLLP